MCVCVCVCVCAWCVCVCVCVRARISDVIMMAELFVSGLVGRVERGSTLLNATAKASGAS